MSRRAADRCWEFCRGWLYRLDPSFTGQPCYFLEPREVKGIFPQVGYNGLTSIGMAGDVRNILEKRGRWSGPGFCAIIDVANITTTGSLLATVAHEYCHFASNSPILSALTAALGLAAVDTLNGPSDSILRGDPPRAVSSDLIVLRQDHDAAFIRVAIHLEHRSARLGRRLLVVDPTVSPCPAADELPLQVPAVPIPGA